MTTPTTVKLLLDESRRDAEEEIGKIERNKLVGGKWTSQPASATSRQISRVLPFCTFTAGILITMIICCFIGLFLLPHFIITNQCQSDELISSEQLKANKLQPLKESQSETNNLFEDHHHLIEECDPSHPWQAIRIPDNIRPLTYKLLLRPNLTTLTFSGSIVIQLKIVNPTNYIILHALQLHLTSYEIQANGLPVPAYHSECERLGQWAFEVVDRQLNEKDNVSLAIDYDGHIQNDLSALYKNVHVSEDGKQIISALTQFEPTHARKMLPCFDEPIYKATFEVSVIRQSQHTVRANMHLEHSEPYTDGLFIDHFAPSVKMSTYLLAIAVLDDFTRIREMTKSTASAVEVPIIFASYDLSKYSSFQQQVNLFAPTKVSHQTEFGLKTGILALEFFESYFAIPYPLQKQDMIALDDFAEGAMENWGMMTFRDEMLLHNSNTSTTKSKEIVALVVCHEYAHQVCLCISDENFLMSMLLDGFNTTHAVSTSVDDPAQIGSIFDAISYQKGASIIAMIMGLTGKENFKMAIRDYLQTYAYGNADGNDLWRVIEKHSSLKAMNLSTMQIAESWTTHVGYPYIAAAIDRNQNSIVIHNQTRFMYLQETQHMYRTEWPIPVHYRSDYSTALNIAWIQPGDQDVRIPLEKSAKWVIVNSNSLGFMRVLYEQKIYDELTEQLRTNHQAISSLDRASIIDDAFAFANAGLLPISTAMGLVRYLEQNDEVERSPWNVIIAHLKMIENCIYDSEHLDLFQQLMRSLLVRAYNRLGWSRKEDHVDRLLQTEILALACKLQIEDCTRQATQRFYQWTRDNESIPIDIQPLVIEEGIRRGTSTDWERVYQEYLQAKSPSKKFMLLAALAATQDIRLIYRFMNICLKPSIIRPSLLPRAFYLLMQNPNARLHAWRFFRIHFEQFDETIGSTTTMLGMMIKSIIEEFNTQFDLDQTLQFFKRKQLKASQPKVDQALDSIRLNIQWRKLNEKSLSKWLHEWNNDRSLQ
ncbi:unnamed protein product [Anisakis simplex]|uniref:Aminopeptidase n=1 Tax=Anisakis simplex TaxID=6269 RepID=A0A158PNB5_ANISI|nr:unnamed protein product [Anisakis simplex]